MCRPETGGGGGVESFLLIFLPSLLGICWMDDVLHHLKTMESHLLVRIHRMENQHSRVS